MPPAFSAMLPPMVQAHALVGSVAKTRPCSAACSIARSVTTPASSSTTCARASRPSASRNARSVVRADPVQLLGVHDHAAGAQRHRAAGEARAGAARDRLEAEPADRGERRRDLRLVVGHHHRDRQVEAPVGRVGRVRHDRERIEEDVVLADDRAELPRHAPAQVRRPVHLRLELREQAPAVAEHLEDARLAVRVPLHEAEVLLDVLEEPAAARGGVDELLEQEGVAAMDQDLAEEPREEPGAASRDAARPELLEARPDGGPEQQRDGLPVVRRGVVERDLAGGRMLAHLDGSAAAPIVDRCGRRRPQP